MENVTGLWLRDAKSGRQYYGGKDKQGNQWMLFLNDKKKQNDPDLSLCVVRAEPSDVSVGDKPNAITNAAEALFGKCEIKPEQITEDGGDDLPF